MSYLDVRRQLLQKLKVTKQALHNRVTQRKKRMPMSTQDAVCLIAHEVGIKIDRHLQPDDLARIRSLISSATGNGHQQQPSSSHRVATDGPRPVEVRFPGNFHLGDPLLSKDKIEEALEMARVYPLLYVLENSIREVIKRVMQAKHGTDWWNTQLTSGKANTVRLTAVGRQQKEETKHAWHQRRGSHPIDYVDLDDLLTIIQAKQTDFVPSVFHDLTWFPNFMTELSPSRNVVCHMNPLSDLNARDIRNKLERWQQLVKTRKAAIP